MVVVVEVVGVVEVVAVVGVVEVVGVVVVVTVVKVVVIVLEAISIVHSFLSPWYNQRGQNRRGTCGPAAPVPRLPRVIKEENLSAKQLRKIWKDEFLSSIRREMKTKILELKSSIKALTERCNAIEKSQNVVCKKYDTAIAALQSVKSQTANLDKNTRRLQIRLKRNSVSWREQSTNKISHCIESNTPLMKLNNI